MRYLRQTRAQRDILQDQLLVKEICSLIQLDYFRHKSQLKTADLNMGQTFATLMRITSEMIMMLNPNEQLRYHAIGDYIS